MPVKSNFKQIVNNSVATLITRGLPGGVKSLLFIMIAKTYDPSIFGKFALVMATLEVFKVVADIGIGTTTLRRFSRKEPVFKTALLINICSSSMAYLSALFFIVFVYGEREYLLMIAVGGISLFFSSTSNTFYSYYHAKLSMNTISGLTIYGAVLSFVLTGMVLYFRLPVYFVLISLALTDGISLALIAVRTLKKEKVQSDHSKILFFEMVREVVPLFFNGIIAVLYLRTNIFLLSFYLGEDVVGSYAAVEFILAPFLLVCSALSPAFFAIFSNPENKASLTPLFKKYLTCIILGAMVFPVVFTLFSTHIAQTFIPKYENVEFILVTLSWVTFLKIVNMFFAQLIFAFGFFKQISLVSLLLFVLNVFLGLMLIPLLGAIGAALALVFTEGFQLLLLLFLSKKVLNQARGELSDRMESSF